MKFNSSGFSSPEENVWDGFGSYQLIFLFLQMPRKLLCSSYTFSELVSNLWHYEGRGVLIFQPFTIFLFCFGQLELKITHPSVVSLAGFFSFGNIKSFTVHVQKCICILVGALLLLPCPWFRSSAELTKGVRLSLHPSLGTQLTSRNHNELLKQVFLRLAFLW